MQKRRLWVGGLFFCFCALWMCGSPEKDPENWQSCHDVGLALSRRVDVCFEEVRANVSVITEKGVFFTLWEDFKVCEVFGERPGMKIDAGIMEQLRACGGWLVGLSCDDVGEKLKRIIVDKQKKVGQPEICNSIIGTLERKFGN